MLYIIATPIGNLGDISYRAIEILNKVDVVACEDTRKSSILMKHYDIKKPLISYHVYNENKNTEKIISMLKEGKTIALISSAGTPIISDPGFPLVREAIKENIEFTVIPGATACINALILSGLASHSFIYKGFPPHKPGKRKNFLKADKDLEYTLIYYESPYRLEKFLTDALEIFGDRDCAIVNDITKLYEKTTRGKISEIIEGIKGTEIKGEYVVVISGA